MQDIFITKIKINEVRNIKDFEIPLSETERKHLIITGKNGSGKTSLLNAAKIFFERLLDGHLNLYDQRESKLLDLNERKKQFVSNHYELEKIEMEIGQTKNWFNMFGGVRVFFNLDNGYKQIPNFVLNLLNKGQFIIKSFEPKRSSNFVETTGVSKVNFREKYLISERIGDIFTQHLVNLQFNKLFAINKDDLETANQIDDWFAELEKQLAELFDKPKFKLSFDIKNYSYQILENGNAPYTFNQLPDGYSAILDIVTELIMRMEEQKGKSYDVQGIVLIDEIETHLHVDLQKKILPFLTSFFPKIQFIVTTHSPFVIQSISNAVICDLEKRIVTEDLSAYSWETIVESYFDSDKYSDELKNKIARYEELLSKENLVENEKDELLELKIYFSKVPTLFADELAIKLNDLNLKAIAKNRK